MAAPASNIRNFSIIAHIDHGKSTLAIAFSRSPVPSIRVTTVLRCWTRWIERERGITIKAQAVRVEYTASDGKLTDCI